MRSSLGDKKACVAWWRVGLTTRAARLACIALLWSGAVSLVRAEPVTPTAQSSAIPAPATNPSNQLIAPPATQPGGLSANEKLWKTHIEPLFNKNCFGCHGATKQKGGLDLRTAKAIFAGGTDGSVVIPGRPGESPLFQRLHEGAEGRMPPEKEPALAGDEIAMIREWIATLPTADRPLAAAAGREWNAKVPSLVEMANAVQYSPPADVEKQGGSAVIDYLIQAKWTEQKVAGNGVCDDRTFVRRIYLDLAGRIPSPAEAEAFVNDANADKRASLVDKLLASNDYAQHLAEVLDVVMMERKGKAAETGRKSRGWMDYLQKSVAANRPWNQMVADVIVARPTTPEQNGAAWFVYERKNNNQAIAEAIAPLAFGVSVACAQCHNHPIAKELKQAQYWGLVAAFNRSANVDGGGVATVSESAVGGFVNFTNLKKESQPAILSFPNDRTIAEVRPADGAKEDDNDNLYIVPPSKEVARDAGNAPKGKRNRDKPGPSKAAVPKFSRRQALADAVTKDNPLLARAFVNRMWAMLLGRGFVNPVGEMDSRHPPSHPELLAWMAGEFAKSGYDIKRLIRMIVLGKTYQLDSRWQAETPPLPELFAKGLEKPLSAEALYRSMLLATGAPPLGSLETSDGEALRQAIITVFPGLFETEYNATLQQSMFLTNNPLLDSLLRPSGKNLTSRLMELPSNIERVELAFHQVLGRPPEKAEREAALAYLEARSDRLEVGVRQMTWALMTGSEFILNH